ncbi:hypothetical protein TNIN_335422 [Trichonephila inaurata madagascariensis]|uniref:Uncharacterized protein n=1 Tax=Trichonephila inaurata madagascariensis TaxID=2747483 RepID=A0A8X6WRX9_9ARAC|nr:hypothetical protein TNIN_335422 [Trichonephila inaurata madagascariensis]
MGFRSAANVWPDTRTFGEYLEEYLHWLRTRPPLRLRTIVDSEEKATKELIKLEKLVKIYYSDRCSLLFIPILLLGLYRTASSLIYLIYDCSKSLTDFNTYLFCRDVLEKYKNLVEQNIDI